MVLYAYQVSIILVVSFMSSLAIGQCPQLEASDLTSTDGLIASALATGENPDGPDVELHSFNTVCLASGGLRDTYSFTSVVANYTCSQTGHAICDEVIPRVSQFDFECVDTSGSPMWTTIVLGTAEFLITDPADGDLNTPLRTNCAYCASPLQLMQFEVDNNTHCLGESSFLVLFKCICI